MVTDIATPSRRIVRHDEVGGERMRILVVGAGAVGGYFGARLVNAGREVTFLVRARRAEEMKFNGLRMVSPHGNLTIYPKAVIAAQIGGSYDDPARGEKLRSFERDG